MQLKPLTLEIGANALGNCTICIVKWKLIKKSIPFPSSKLNELHWISHFFNFSPSTAICLCSRHLKEQKYLERQSSLVTGSLQLHLFRVQEDHRLTGTGVESTVSEMFLFDYSLPLLICSERGYSMQIWVILFGLAARVNQACFVKIKKNSNRQKSRCDSLRKGLPSMLQKKFLDLNVKLNRRLWESLHFHKECSQLKL